MLPGLVDGHVHFHFPGHEHWEGYWSKVQGLRGMHDRLWKNSFIKREILAPPGYGILLRRVKLKRLGLRNMIMRSNK